MNLCGCVLFFAVHVFVVYYVICSNLTSNDDLYRLDVVHYNDFHDRFEETSLSNPICKTNDTNCLGGFSRLYHEIMTLLKQKPEALLLNAGDTYQGTYWYTLLKWNVTQKFINLLPNDAHAIGNHEFDGGVVGLAPYLAALKAPVLAANMKVDQEPSLKGLFKPHLIVERKGRKIGIIGLITPKTAESSNSENVKFLDPIVTVQKEAQLLTGQGVDIIIVLSHCGLDVDMEMANKVGENIDIIVGGHTHSLLWNGPSPSAELVSGPYPVVVNTETKLDHKVLVVTASAFSKYLGNVTAYFDGNGDLQTFNGEPVYLNRSIPEDPEISALLEPIKEHLHSLVDVVIGSSSGDFMDTNCGAQECALGVIVADSLLDAAKQKNVSDLPAIAFLPRNVIKGSIQKGDITLGSVINSLPYTNEIVSFTLAGRYVVEVMENCLTHYWQKKPFNGPFMPQIAGLKVTLNTTSGKVVTAAVKEDDFKPLDLNKEYQFVTTNFLYKGREGFEVLNEHGRNATVVGVDTNILEAFIRKTSPVSPYLDNRLTIVN